MTKVVTFSSLLGTINSFLLIEDKIIIVDSGYSGHYQKIINYFKKNKIDTSLVSLIILTHAHLDHYDNTIRLINHFHAPVLVTKPAKQCFLEGKNEFTEPQTIFAKLLKLIFYQTKFNKITPDITISNKYDISHYGVCGFVLPTPGHTEGSLSIVFNTHECICGDLCVNIPSKTVWFINNKQQYLHSIQILKDLHIQKYYPSHGKSFTIVN